MSEYLTGVYNITPTPFHPDGSLDEASLKRRTAFTRDKGVNGMTILGVPGEADKLTEAERDRVIALRGTAGDLDGATEVFYRYMPLIRFENQARINLALRKEIYQRRGAIRSARVRAPFTPVDGETLNDLDHIMRRLALS